MWNQRTGYRTSSACFGVWVRVAVGFCVQTQEEEGDNTARVAALKDVAMLSRYYCTATILTALHLLTITYVDSSFWNQPRLSLPFLQHTSQWPRCQDLDFLLHPIPMISFESTESIPYLLPAIQSIIPKSPQANQVIVCQSQWCLRRTCALSQCQGTPSQRMHCQQNWTYWGSESEDGKKVRFASVWCTWCLLWSGKTSHRGWLKGNIIK